jgi:hypothetical protein
VVEKRPYNRAKLSLEGASICCLCVVAAVERRYNANRGSIRINKQWRLCFTWKDGDAFDVEIVDYHRALLFFEELRI